MSDVVVFSDINTFGTALIKHYNALPHMDRKNVGVEVNNGRVYIRIKGNRKDLIEQFNKICKGDPNVV